jgi:N-acetylglucosaminyl-diphospho-decaprenol L-rhamnosyltransferase
MDYCIVIPVFNQLPFTVNCLESLNADGIPDSKIVVVNNGSTDGTGEFLATRPEIKTIENPENRGCGFAWNQGAKSSSARWTVVLNNDVLVAPKWMEGLLGFAEEERFDVVSPAMCEGEHDYDWPAYAETFMRKMADVRREGIASGVCFMVHRRVFDAIGFFDDDPRLGGYEDDEFFRRARRAGFRLAVTGRAFLHHFGSVTQKSIRENWKRPNASLGDRAYYRKKSGQTWFNRHRDRLRQDLRLAFWRLNERWRFGLTLRSTRVGGIVKHL